MKDEGGRMMKTRMEYQEYSSGSRNGIAHNSLLHPSSFRLHPFSSEVNYVD